MQDRQNITMNHASCEEIITPNNEGNLFNKMLKKTSTGNRKAVSKNYNNLSFDNQNYLQ